MWLYQWLLPIEVTATTFKWDGAFYKSRVGNLEIVRGCHFHKPLPIAIVMRDSREK